MKLKIAVCDNEKTERRIMLALVRAWADECRYLVDLAEFSSAEAFWLEFGEARDYDILMLDIKMGEMNGVELARLVRAKSSTIQLIFVTGYYEYFSDGFDVSAVHYLLKPVSEQRLFPALDRAVANLSYRKRSVLLHTADEYIRVPLADILYIEADRAYVAVYTRKNVYRCRMAISKLAEELDDTFFRVHRSYIVALTQICKISRGTLLLSDGTQLPLARGMYDAVHDALIRYL